MAKISWDSEKELEDYMYGYFNKYLTSPIDDLGIDAVFRQFNVDPYGVIDLITFSINYPEVCINIYEIKKDKITTSSIAQVTRYKKAIEHLFAYKAKLLGNKYKDFKEFDELPVFINCFVVAPEICLSDDTVFLYNELDNITLITVNLDLVNGISFNEIGKNWVKEDDGRLNNNNVLDELLNSHNQPSEITIKDNSDNSISSVYKFISNINAE
jgi:hypothetical protein